MQPQQFNSDLVGVVKVFNSEGGGGGGSVTVGVQNSEFVLYKCRCGSV